VVPQAAPGCQGGGHCCRASLSGRGIGRRPDGSSLAPRSRRMGCVGGMKAPKCRLCEAAHWSNQPHVFAATSVPNSVPNNALSVNVLETPASAPRKPEPSVTNRRRKWEASTKEKHRAQSAARMQTMRKRRLCEAQHWSNQPHVFATNDATNKSSIGGQVSLPGSSMTNRGRREVYARLHSLLGWRFTAWLPTRALRLGHSRWRGPR
jgi:hypothetical protein